MKAHDFLMGQQCPKTINAFREGFPRPLATVTERRGRHGFGERVAEEIIRRVEHAAAVAR